MNRDESIMSVPRLLARQNLIHGRRSHRVLPFEDSRKFVRQLKLRDYPQYFDWAQRFRPEGIPLRPDTSYKGKGWISYADFLGSDYVHRDKATKNEEIHNQAVTSLIEHAALAAPDIEFFFLPHVIQGDVLFRCRSANSCLSPGLDLDDGGWVPLQVMVSSPLHSQAPRYTRSVAPHTDTVIVLTSSAFEEYHVFNGSSFGTITSFMVNEKALSRFNADTVRKEDIGTTLTQMYEAMPHHSRLSWLRRRGTTGRACRYAIFLEHIIRLVYSPCGFWPAKVVFPLSRAECSIILDGKRIVHRVGAHENLRKGIRGEAHRVKANFDFFLLAVPCPGDQDVLQGFFLAPRARAILAFYWYPPYVKLDNPRSMRTQQWQKEFYIPVTDSTETQIRESVLAILDGQ